MEVEKSSIFRDRYNPLEDLNDQEFIELYRVIKNSSYNNIIYL